MYRKRAFNAQLMENVNCLGFLSKMTGRETSRKRANTCLED